MKVCGRCLRCADDINTDIIIAGKYTKTLDMQMLAAHAFEDFIENYADKAKLAPFLVAGSNFGCGSSREQAPLALIAAGTRYVIAKSFARIFYRNAVNIGLIPIEADTDGIAENSELEFDTKTGELLDISRNVGIKAAPIEGIILDIFTDGGLINYLNKRNGAFGGKNIF